MKEALKQFAEKMEKKNSKGKHKWFQRDNLIILVLSGILLLIIALPTKDSSGVTSEESGEENSSSQENQQQTGNISREGTLETQDEYASYLEQRLEQVLGSMDGVGKVSVMITMQSSEELVVEKDEPVSRSSTTESDSEGGKREVSQTENSQTTVYRKTGNDSEPYVIKTMAPKVAGVVVVAEGAGSGSINKTITEAVQALFGVEAHKVKVLKMEKDG